MADPVVLVPLMTTAGLQAVFSATNQGLSAEITHVALGDQGYEPDAGAVGLHNELVRVPIAGGEAIPDSVQIHLTAVADAGTPEFWVREVGFVLSDGTFLAIWSDAALVLAYRSALSDLLLALDVVLAGVPAGSVTVQEGELYVGQATATRQGVVRLATQAETDVGEEPLPAVTPETLGGVLARLPFYPEVDTADHRMTVTDNGDGSITVDAGQTWTWRGWRQYATDDYAAVDRTFSLSPSTTYHLRWTPTDGFGLFDLADVGYNPSAAAEDSNEFDTGYDSMLIALVVTDAGGIATIDTLANAVHLYASFAATPTPEVISPNYNYRASATWDVRWARTPRVHEGYGFVAQTSAEVWVHGGANFNRDITATRNVASMSINTDWSGAALNLFAGCTLGLNA